MDEIDLPEQNSWFDSDFETAVAEIEALRDLADLIMSEDEDVSAVLAVNRP